MPYLFECNKWFSRFLLMQPNANITYLNACKNKKDDSCVNTNTEHKSRNKLMRSSVSLKFIIFLKLGVITPTSLH